MSKKGKQSTISIAADQRREIIGIASQVAIEKYQKAVEKHRKEAKDRRHHKPKHLLNG